MPNQLNQEQLRIKAAYAKRPSNDPRYSWFNPGYMFMEQEHEREFVALLKRQKCVHTLNEKRILEVGCGTGYRLWELIKYGARPENLVGIDLLPNHVAETRRLCPEKVAVYCGSAEKLDFCDAAFDVVLQSMLFTSVLDPNMKQRIASEMLRVTKPDGFIIWYDFHVNNPRNPDVRGVKKREIRKLFPDCQIELRRITLAPPITRSLARCSWILCYLLNKIPLLCTHYLGVIRKK